MENISNHEDPISNFTMMNENSSKKIMDESKTIVDDKASGPFWIVLDILYLSYCITILVIVMKKHRHNLEPVHILTMMPLVDLILTTLNLLIFEVMSLIGYECQFEPVFKTLFGLFELCFQLDVLTGDLNGFIFVGFDVYYHEYITNNVAFMSLVINKVIGVILTVVTNLMLPIRSTCNIVCILFFSSIAFYLSCIPFFICFSISIPIIFYMSYAKYRISKIETTHNNLTNPQVKGFQQKLQIVGKMRKSQTKRTLSSSLHHAESQVSNIRKHLSRQVCPLPSSSSSHVPNPVPSVSGTLCHEDQQRIPSPRLAWQDPSLWIPPTSCLHPAVSTFFNNVKKYVKFNIYSCALISINLPFNVMILIIKFGNLKCEEWGQFTEGFEFFQIIFSLTYPYFVKLKLDNFLTNQPI